MSTPPRASAVQIAARLPGSSRTVVRIRHSVVVSAASVAGPGTEAAAVDTAAATAPGPEGAVPVGGGAWL